MASNESKTNETRIRLGGLPYLLTKREVATVCRVHERTVGHWIALGLLESVRIIAGAGSSRCLIPRESLERFLSRTV